MSAWAKLVKGVTTAGEGAVKHPVATVGTIGGAAAVSENVDKSDKKEGDLMDRYSGNTGKNAEDLEALNSFRMQTKTAALTPMTFGGEFSKGLAGGLGGGIAAAALGVGLMAAINGIKGVRDKASYGKAREQILEQVLASDPVISRFAKEHPDEVEKLYATMSRFAPKLSTDVHAVTSFLRNVIMMGGAVDYRTIQGLAEAEAAIDKASPYADTASLIGRKK
jgi:hypothetical protein